MDYQMKSNGFGRVWVRPVLMVAMAAVIIAAMGAASLQAQQDNGSAAAAADAERPTAELPIRRVALFASGVGYFERSGPVTGGSDVQMMFRVEEINDILKSMVITGGEHVMVTYGSRDPVSRALRAF